MKTANHSESMIFLRQFRSSSVDYLVNLASRKPGMSDHAAIGYSGSNLLENLFENRISKFDLFSKFETLNTFPLYNMFRTLIVNRNQKKLLCTF